MTRLAFLASATNCIRRSLQSLSAEPAVLVYSFVLYAFSSAMPNLIQQKVCSPVSQPPTNFVCNDTALLKEATEIVTIRSILRQALPAIILIFVGFWKDSTGLNKLTFYFGLFWDVVAACVQMYAYFDWTSSAKITSIVEGLIAGFGGNSNLFYTGSVCAITDSTKPEDRTSRLTFMTAEIFIGACLAFGGTGYLITNLGYTSFFTLAILLQLISAVLIMIFVKDNLTEEKKTVRQSMEQFKLAFKKKPNIMIVWFMVIANCLSTMSIQGEINIYQYYLQQAFGYSIEGAGVYISYRLLVTAIGAIVTSYILCNVMKMSEFSVGITSTLLTIISCVSMVFATTQLELLIFAFFDVTKVVLCGVPKSIITKCANKDELGLFISFCYITSSIVPILMFYIYDLIYTSTVTTLPGAFYLFSAALNALFLILHCISVLIYTPVDTCENETKNNP